jgi:hypothetical protein
VAAWRSGAAARRGAEQGEREREEEKTNVMFALTLEVEQRIRMALKPRMATAVSTWRGCGFVRRGRNGDGHSWLRTKLDARVVTFARMRNWPVGRLKPGPQPDRSRQGCTAPLG